MFATVRACRSERRYRQVWALAGGHLGCSIALWPKEIDELNSDDIDDALDYNAGPL